MEELRNALDILEEETGKYYGITAALPCGPSHLENINVPELSKYLSELNLMTYGKDMLITKSRFYYREIYPLMQSFALLCKISMVLGIHFQVSNLNSVLIPSLRIRLTKLCPHSNLEGVNSPLYDSVHDPEPGWSVDGCVRNWSERGAPKEKMNIGLGECANLVLHKKMHPQHLILYLCHTYLGFYGRSFLNAKALHEPHGGTDDKTWAVDEGTPQYFVST